MHKVLINNIAAPFGSLEDVLIAVFEIDIIFSQSCSELTRILLHIITIAIGSFLDLQST